MHIKVINQQPQCEGIRLYNMEIVPQGNRCAWLSTTYLLVIFLKLHTGIMPSENQITVTANSQNRQ